MLWFYQLSLVISRSHDTPDSSIPTQPTSKHSELSDYLSTSTQAKDVLPGKPAPPARPLTIHFKAILKGLTVGASLLPSLKAEYKVIYCFIYMSILLD